MSKSTNYSPRAGTACQHSHAWSGARSNGEQTAIFGRKRRNCKTKQLLLELFEESGSLDPQAILLRLAMAVVIGAFIFLSYRLSHEGSIYSRKFNVSLVAMTVITTTVMVVIGNNIALSLGMVGALSIVRFRTAIKDSRDTIYIF